MIRRLSVLSLSAIFWSVSSAAQLLPQAPAGTAVTPPAPAAGAPAPGAGAADSDAAKAAAKAEARARFERGLQLYKDVAYDAALAEFRRSRELFPTRAASQNGALALRKLNRFDEALDTLEQVAREYPNLAGADKQALDRELAEVLLLVGLVRIVSTEAGATVLIDGRERGTTPLAAPVRVAAGSRLVRVFKEGFLQFETRVEVAGRETASLDAKLGALTKGGRLSVSEDRGTAVKVIVDGIPMGNTPWEGILPVGPHTVTLKGEGDIGSPPASVDVRLNQLSKLSLVAEPLPCSLRIEPTPLSASVAVDSVDVGHGVWQGAMRCGGHAVEIAQQGFLPVARTVSLSKENTFVVNESLERDQNSPLWRAANPSRITLELRGGFVFGPPLGGDPNDSCGAGCKRGLATGFMAMVGVGYQLGSGLGFALDAGYLRIGQKVEGRTAAVYPLGLPANPGTAKDTLTLSGPTLGVAATIERGETLVYTGRLGVGAMLGTWSDVRSGTFGTVAIPTTANPTPSAVTYNTPELTETGGVRYLYINPEVRLGYRFGKHWVADIGVQAMVLIGLSDATWTDATELSAGKCPSMDTNQCAGRAGYGHASVLGKTLVMASPLAGVRYEF